MVTWHPEADEKVPANLSYEMVVTDWSRVARSFVRSLHAYESVNRLRTRRLERGAQPAVMDAQTVVVDAPAAPWVTVDAHNPALSSSAATRGTPLTPRQFEVAQLIAQGLSNADIADRLVLTPGTVGNHVADILRRLGARNRAQVAAWVVSVAAQPLR